MGYNDRVYGNRSDDTPNCWGRQSTYDPTDPECNDCRYLHSCREEAEGNGGRTFRKQYRSTPRRSTRTEEGVEDVSYDRGEPVKVEVMNKKAGKMVKKEQSVGERFLKDAASGAIRGALYEMYQFWKRYRIP